MPGGPACQPGCPARPDPCLIRAPLLPRSIIAENFLERWWADLEATLGTDAHVDTQTIHRIVTQ